jgi:hypothetical protein
VTARQDRAARAKAALISAGGRIERQANFIAATGLPWSQGRQAIYDLRDTDDGSDGTFTPLSRGRRGGVYELTHSMERVRTYTLTQLRTALRKELNRYLAYRQTLTRIDPGRNLDEWGEVSHRMRTSADQLVVIGNQIKAEAAEAGIPAGSYLRDVRAAGINV